MPKRQTILAPIELVGPDQLRKLERLVVERGCSIDELVRAALDRYIRRRTNS